MKALTPIARFGRIAAAAASLLSMISCATATPQSTAVRRATSPADYEYCQDLGVVSTRMMALEKDVEIELKNLAAKRGGNVIAVVEGTEQSGFGRAQAYRCDVDQQNAIRAKLAEAARTPVTCTSQTECEVRWAKAIRWLQDNSRWKFRNVTDNLVTTEGPMDSSNAAFEVTRVPHGDGKTYEIVLRAWCGANQCRPSVLELGADFARVVGQVDGQAEHK